MGFFLTSVIQGQKQPSSNSFQVEMLTWNWGVIEFTACVAADEYDPLEVLGCCLIVHWDYLCITMLTSQMEKSMLNVITSA